MCPSGRILRLYLEEGNRPFPMTIFQPSCKLPHPPPPGRLDTASVDNGIFSEIIKSLYDSPGAYAAFGKD